MKQSFLYLWILSQLNYFVTAELTITIHVSKKRKQEKKASRQTQFNRDLIYVRVYCIARRFGETYKFLQILFALLNPKSTNLASHPKRSGFHQSITHV
jgi:tetrahydromethanopterin S-methyltransferase subunit B